MSEVFNPWSLPRPAVREDEREYTDPRHPGVSVKLRFREMNPFSEGQALRLYGEYYERWVKPKAAGNGKEPGVQLLPTPEPVLLNEVTLDQMVMLQAMHVPAAGQQKYGLIEWSGFAVNMPDAYREMLRVCHELNAARDMAMASEQDSGNASAPASTSGAPSSNPPSGSDSLIPNGSSMSPDVSEVSPEACEPSLPLSTFPPGKSEWIPA